MTRNTSWFKRVKGHRESESDFDDIQGGDNEVDMESADTVSTTNEVEVELTGNGVMSEISPSVKKVRDQKGIAGHQSGMRTITG